MEGEVSDGTVLGSGGRVMYRVFGKYCRIPLFAHFLKIVFAVVSIESRNTTVSFLSTRDRRESVLLEDTVRAYTSICTP